jgi:PAS domain S-box-containing protein
MASVGSEPPSVPLGTGKRALAVDDDPASLYLWSKLLRGAGFTVEEASTGEEALSRVESWRPNLVVLDVNLPDSNGFDICRLIKQEHPDILVLQHSAAFTRGSDRILGLQGGADGYVVTPVEPEELIANVNALMRLKQAEEKAQRLADEAQEAKRTLDAVMRYVPTGITIADAPDATIRRISDYGLALTQRDRGDLEGIAAKAHPEAWQIYHPDGTTLPSPDELPLTRATKNGELVTDEEWILRRPDGSNTVILCSAGPIRDAAGRTSGGIMAWRDIDSLKSTEAALRASEARLQLAQSAAGIGTWEMGIGTDDVIWSPQQWELLGLDPAQFTPTYPGFLALVHEEDRPRVIEEANRCVAERRPFDCEFRICRPDGAVRWIVGRGVLSFDPAGRPVRMVGINRDVTTRREAEETLRRARSDAEGAARAKGRMLAAVAHDLLQPLQAISGTVELLQLRNSNIEPAALHRIMRAVEQMKGSVDMLMDSARMKSGTIEPELEILPIQPLIDETVESFRLSARERGLELRTVRCSARVRSDRRMLGQMLQNLLGNAIKYSQSGGVVVGCRRRGQTLRLQVVDTGIGIPAEKTDVIFDEFLRLDDSRGSGMGLGLSIVKGTADRLGHKVAVRSVPGKGSVFAIELPLCPGRSGDAGDPRPPVDR